MSFMTSKKTTNQNIREASYYCTFKLNILMIPIYIRFYEREFKTSPVLYVLSIVVDPVPMPWVL